MKAHGDRAVRLSGLVGFLASLAVCGWWWMTRAGDALPFAGVGAIAVDSALFLIFALHHSLFARPWAQASRRTHRAATSGSYSMSGWRACC